MTDTKTTREAREAAQAAEPQAGKTGPHMIPPAIGDRFPTEAGGHPVPDINDSAGDKPQVHLRTGEPGSGARLMPDDALSGKGQAMATGRNPPDPDESQIERGSAITDPVDAAQNERPGVPANVTIKPNAALDEPRRREFDKAVAEHGSQAEDGNDM
jgi:hypothetical protein